MSNLFIEKICKENGILETLFNENDVTHHFQENDVIEAFLLHVKKIYKFNVITWNNFRDGYPEYIFLGGDKGILAYVSIKYFEGDNLNNRDVESPLNEIIKSVKLSYSQLDRPIFYIKILNYRDYVSIVFETGDMIRDRILNDSTCIDRISNTYIPDIDTMGHFSDLVKIWNNLKRYGVKLQ